MNRQLTVLVNLQASGNLAQGAAAAAAQAAKLNQATKGALAAAAQHRITDATNRMAFSRSAPGVAATQAEMGIAGVGRITDAENRLAYLRSGAGAAATVKAIQVETALAKQQERLAQFARTGAGPFGAVQRFVETVQPLTRAAGALGAAGLATAYGGIASVSPEASSQITNSFRMIANEIGIATIPAATRFTSVLQSLSRGIRTVNESTGGWAGNLAFVGATALAGVGALGAVGNVVSNTVSGLRWLGILGEAAAPAAGHLAGRALGGGASAAPTAAGTPAASSGGGSWLAALALSPLGLIGGGAIAGGAVEAATGQNLPGGFEMGMNLAQGKPLFSAGQIGAAGIGTGGPENVANLNPQSYGSALELYQAMSMQSSGTPGPLAEQENRAMTEWLAAINANTKAINAAGGSGDSTWGAPPASENG